MFSEIRRAERITDRFEERRRREREGFRKIKPKKEMTVAECDAFFRDVFQKAHEEAIAASQGK